MCEPLEPGKLKLKVVVKVFVARINFSSGLYRVAVKNGYCAILQEYEPLEL